MNFEQVKKTISGGPVKVRFKAGIEDAETGLANGMMARLTSAERDGDDMIFVVFDTTGFDDFNDPLLTHDFRNRDGSGFNLTAKEAGFWNDVEKIYGDISQDFSDWFEVVEDNALLNEFIEESPTCGYARWLEERLLRATKPDAELLKVAVAMREWIDAVPKDVALPAMPGFDRDWADAVIAKAGG